MSLAEELLADLEGGDEDEEDEIMDQEPVAGTLPMDTGTFVAPLPKLNTEFNPKKSIKKEVKPGVVLEKVTEIAHLHGSEQLNSVMKSIEEFSTSTRNAEDIKGPVEADPEYQLIVEANNLAVDIDNEIGVIHKFVRDKYNVRFPELESLVLNPLEYLITVKELGNDLSKVKYNPVLQQTLTQATIMVLSVTASTTQGTHLSSEVLTRVYEACDMALELNACKVRILAYVESRMTFIAPNLATIVGASTAAKLMGLAGGLTALSKMPSCNVLVLGTQKKALAGFSSVAIQPHTGYIFYCPLVQESSPDLRRKAARLVSAKCTLAARVDSFHESTNGQVGKDLREEIEKKMDKLQEPPPVKFVKPLPAPLEGPRKRRGGKRVRRMKERYALTEFRKQANRMTFAQIEEDAYQEDLGYSRGVLGKTGSGKVRGPTVDEKTKVRISKALQRNLQKSQAFGGTTTVKKQVAGTSSSVAFTPLQGLEIVNPQAAEKKVSEVNAKYFSSHGGFLNINKPT
nr:EOG090X06EY [Lepidurus arcticus]